MMWGLALSALAGLISALSTAVLQPSWSLLVLLLGRGLLGLGEPGHHLGPGLGRYAGRSRALGQRDGLGRHRDVRCPGSRRADRSCPRCALRLCGAVALRSSGAALGPRRHALAKAVQPVGGVRLPFYQVSRLIWLPGVGLSLCALGFGAIAAFATLFFTPKALPMPHWR